MTRVLLAGAATADTKLAHTLRQEGYDACTTAEPSDIDVVLWGQRDGDIEYLRQCKDVPIIVLSRNPDPKAIVSAMRAGASDYLVRPFSRGELCASLELAHNAKNRDQPTAAGLAHLLGDSEPMQKLRALITRVGATQSPVLISGETGSGKELVARAVHASSPRNAQPLIVMNCAAVPEALQEIELFGEASTSTSPIGLIEAAHNSSLFLDDVAELTKGAQAKLLHVIETGQNRRLGATGTRPADVRLICACPGELQTLADAGHFRQDLYYRLNVVSLVPPPLRERGVDIELLAQHFLKRSARKLGRKEAELTKDALDSVKRYGWPGNVREMENAIERAVILAADNRITAELLAIDISAEAPTEPVVEAEPNISLEDYFVKFVTENQDQCTETELAERLGISRKSLWERRQRLNIPRKRTKKRAPRRS